MSMTSDSGKINLGSYGFEAEALLRNICKHHVWECSPLSKVVSRTDAGSVCTYLYMCIQCIHACGRKMKRRLKPISILDRV